MSDVATPPVASCPECVHLRTLLDAALHRIAELEAEVRDLRGQLTRNSSNSSTPPSADPPGAPKPVVKRPTGRLPGGQPGHPGHHRQRLPAERVNHVIRYVPTTCLRCHSPLPDEPAPHDPEPQWHQVAELPKIAAVVTEHQGHSRTCPKCGLLNSAEIPPAVRAHVLGPRLTAVMSYFSGRHHNGKRGVQEIVETVFQVPVSLGTVAALEQEMSAALAPAHTEAGQAVREAPAKNVDETGWKQAGQKRWLWGAATATVAFFVIHARRNWEGLYALLGATIHGIVGSDRWSVYNKVALHLRQLCWAHLKRDFQKCVDRGGSAVAIGQAGLKAVEDVFRLWWDFRQRQGSRAELHTGLEPVIQELQEALEQGRTCADPKVATFCTNVLALYPALWLFATVEGVEPTNNHIERLLRPGVLWRKNAFGNHSEAGCRFAERILTVVQTLRLQKRQVVDYLHQALVAHRSGQPAPKLLMTAGD
jgi:transposase